MLKYGGEGFKAFLNRAKTAIHIKNSMRAKEAVSFNQFISKSKEGNLGYSDHSVHFHLTKVQQEVLFLSFLAEKSLSFIQAPKIIKLSQALSKNQVTLNALSVSRTTVSYKLKYRILKTIVGNLINILKNT